MKPTLVNYVTPYRLVGSSSVILLFALFTAAAWAWGPDSSAQPDTGLVDASFQELRDLGEQGREKCAECGVVESTQVIKHGDEKPGEKSGRSEMAATSDTTAEVKVTVRMSDGSSRHFNDTSPASWRRGERVIIIGGYDPVID